MTPCFATLKRRMLTVTLALFLAQQWLGSAEAVAAGIVPAPNAPAANHPLTDTARNGVPIVDIAPPSAAGVSNNQYSQFNTASNGAILNNSTGNVQTQLGGWPLRGRGGRSGGGIRAGRCGHLRWGTADRCERTGDDRRRCGV
jgi:filamentous hemagglutinin